MSLGSLVVVLVAVALLAVVAFLLRSRNPNPWPSIVVAMLTSGICFTVGGDATEETTEPSVATVVVPSGTTPERGGPTTATPRAASSSLSTRAASAAGSGAGTVDDRLRSGEKPAKPSLTMSPSTGPIWSCSMSREAREGW